MQENKDLSFIKKWAIVGALAVSMGIGAWYAASVFHLTPELPKQVTLAVNVSISGQVSQETLRLTSSEIEHLNACALNTAEHLKKIELSVNYDEGIQEMSPSTVLAWAITLDTQEGNIVHSWPKRTQRAKLVEQMVVQIFKTVHEYEELKQHPDVLDRFKQIYI